MKKNINRITFIILCIIVLFTTITYGYNYKLPEPNYDFYVFDEAEIINSITEKYIVDINKDLYNKTGAQVVFVTVKSLDKMDINYYATALFEKWKIGGKEKDNGILVLIVPEDNEIWIEVGYGLEGKFPSVKTKRIIDNYIIPNISENDYSDGVLAGFNQFLIGIEEEYNISIKKSNIVDNNDNNSFSTFHKILAMIGIIIFLFIDFKFFRGMITFSLLRGIGRGGSSGGGNSGGRSSGGGGRSGGGGAGSKR